MGIHMIGSAGLSNKHGNVLKCVFYLGSFAFDETSCSIERVK